MKVWQGFIIWCGFEGKFSRFIKPPVSKTFKKIGSLMIWVIRNGSIPFTLYPTKINNLPKYAPTLMRVGCIREEEKN